MSDRSVAKFGGTAAIVTGAAYAAVLVSAALMPPELRGGASTSQEFWTALSRQPIAALAFHWSWVVCGIAALGVIPAISKPVRNDSEGLVGFAAALAYLGYAVIARGHLMEVAWVRRILPAYDAAEPAFQQAVHVVSGLALDAPDGLLTHGGVGLWIIVVSLLAMLGRGIPKSLGRLGVAAGALNWLSVVGYVCLVQRCAVAPMLLTIGLGAGNMLCAVWFVWYGVRLRNPSITPDLSQRIVF